MLQSQDPFFLIVGAGFSGAAIARSLADAMPCRVRVVDERPHIAGNCHTQRDSETGVMVHVYGPHIFNTDNERVWRYVNEHAVMQPFVNRVKAVAAKGVFSLPINLHTINQFFGLQLDPQGARELLSSLGDVSITEPANFEEQALKFLGRELYEAFFYGYTKKQWGCEPRELPASILKRLPVRFNYDDNYYSKRWQGIPLDGYSSLISSILNHPGIEVRLNQRLGGKEILSLLKGEGGNPRPDHVFYTGPIDAFFGYSEGRLGYRTVEFERIVTSLRDYQGNAVLNYTDEKVPWTRIHEHKHFAPWESHDRTVAFREFSKETADGDVPFYPKRLQADKSLLLRYRDDALGLAAQGMNISFLGRLATYRYMDMETVIGEALEFTDAFLEAWRHGTPKPVFPNVES